MVKDEEKISRDEASEVMIAAVEGLTMITNQQFGTSAVNWEGWYTLVETLRYWVLGSSRLSDTRLDDRANQ